MSPARITASVISTTLIGALFVGGAPANAESTAELFLDFNGRTGATPNLYSSGTAPVTTAIASSEGGTIVGVKHPGAGRAARFEPFDDEAPAELAVLVIRPDGDDDPFAPGGDPFSFGAAFRLDRQSQGSDVDDGNNLIQRGLFDDDAQYKLQIDDQRISCRVTGSAGSVLVQATSDLRTARWHRTRCTRKDRTVVLRLVRRTSDGVVRHRWSGSGDIGDLAFTGAPPLAVGGKINNAGDVVESSSDQFNGRVDNVFFRRLGG